jgi:uncharacterized membrane protein
MDSQFGPGGRAFWLGGPRWSGSYDPSIRVSDAERTEISDILSKHYAEGRLDDAEFRVRLDKALAAKTRGDLSGLLTDLPPLQGQEPRRRSRLAPRAWWGFTMMAMVFLGLWVASAITTPHIPWVLFLVVAWILWRHRFGYHHHHHRSDAYGR